jgi:hypothetical protein
MKKFMVFILLVSSLLISSVIVSAHHEKLEYSRVISSDDGIKFKSVFRERVNKNGNAGYYDQDNPDKVRYTKPSKFTKGQRGTFSKKTPSNVFYSKSPANTKNVISAHLIALNKQSQPN